MFGQKLFPQSTEIETLDDSFPHQPISQVNRSKTDRSCISPRRSQKRFAGRISARLIALGVASACGTAVVAPQMMPEGKQSAAPSFMNSMSEGDGSFDIDPETFSIGNSETRPQSIDSTQSLSSDESIPKSIAAPEPSGSGRAKLTDFTSQPIRDDLPLEVSESETPVSADLDRELNITPAIGNKIRAQGAVSGRFAVKTAEKLPYDVVRIYYATDREEINLRSMLLWCRIILPTGLGVLICTAMVAGLRFGRDKYVWGAGLGLSCLLTVYFGFHTLIYAQQTIRMSENRSVAYGTRRFDRASTYPLHLGVVDVSLPKIHKTGRIERPSVFRAEFAERADRHVMLQRIEPTLEDEFFRTLKNEIDDSQHRSAFVFVHGYNVQFDEAALRTAQIAWDLKFDGAPILYSWPSNGQLVYYGRDVSNVTWTVTHLETFLWDVRQRTGAENIHIIAHSMGNRAMIAAMERLVLRHPDVQPMFNQVVLAAPDVDVSEFNDRYAESVDVGSRRATLYTSSSDRALLASKRLNGNRRLGLTTDLSNSYQGIDHVDVSPIDPSFLGHSYYGSQPLLIQDMQALVELGQPPTMRQWLSEITTTQGLTAWHFLSTSEWKSDIANRPAVLSR